MRVLISTIPGIGHVLPVVPLARALAERGHDVLWATAEDAGPMVAAAGLRTASAGMPEGEFLHRRNEVLATRQDLRPEQLASFMFPRLFGAIRAPAMLVDLLPLARVWRPDLMLHEQAELAAPLVADVLGVPSVLHSFGTVVPPAYIDETTEVLAPLWAEHGRSVPAYAGCYRTMYLDICPHAMQLDPLTHLPRVQPLRPVPYADAGDGEVPALVTHDDGRPLIYVTMGTVFNNSPALAAVVAGAARVGARVLVTVGPRGEPAALGEQPRHVAVERWVPQTEVLPRCAVVVTHAGSGTVLAALGQGRPLVCLPQAADQFRNSAAVEAAGAGLVLRPGEITPDAVEAAVRAALVDPSYAASAQRVAVEIAAMPSPAQVVEQLEALV